jgi:hypothetical protein
VLFFYLHAIAADTPYLERTLTIALHDERLDVALQKISQQAGFTFSYNPSILESGRIVNYNFTNKSVREILDQLFNGTIQYKPRGKYVILTKTQLSNVPRQTEVVSGYVVDESTGERLKDVSVYDPVSLSSTITDAYGYFELEIDKPGENLKLAVNKQNYSDTLVVPSRNGRLLNIPMKFDADRITTLADSVGQKIKRFWSKTKAFTVRQANLVNIDDTLYRDAQFSIVPFIGTNHALSGNVINDYSLNLLGGYSLGVRKFELGGIFNTVRGDVHGIQIAGTFNAVAGSVSGVQLAGMFNANRGPTNGAQIAGVFNFNWGESRYLSLAGMFNFARHTSRAVQVAGIGNLSLEQQESPQLAGLFNFSARDASAQLAGVYNFAAKNVHGWQGAGVLNFAGKEVTGAQTAGVLNFAGKGINGVQIAGVLNYATRVRGAQLGLINVADSVKGVPIGFLSFVMKGYHKVEVSADEIFYTNVAFRTGVKNFYNIFMAGAKPSTFGNDATFWAFGYGVGTAPKLSRKLFLNIDVTSQQIAQGNDVQRLNMINKIFLGVDYQVLRKMSFTAGLTLNGYLTDTRKEGYWPLFTDYQPHIFYDHTYSNDINMKMWIGGKVGIRFL